MTRVTLLALTALAACRPLPALHLEVHLPTGYDTDELLLEASIYIMPGEVSCDHFAYGDLSLAELLSTRVAHAELEAGSGEVSAIPRSGRKIIVVEGRAREHGGDSSRPAVAARCVELDASLTGPTTVQVSLEPAIQLTVSDQDGGRDVNGDGFEATVEWGGEVAIEPTLQFRTRTGKGEIPAPATRTRVRLIGPSGAVLDEQLIPNDASGQATYQARASFAGPCRIEVAARWALEPEPAVLTGLVLPHGAEMTSSTYYLWAAPSRLGHDGSGFLSLVLGGGRVLCFQSGQCFLNSTRVTGFTGSRVDHHTAETDLYRADHLEDDGRPLGAFLSGSGVTPHGAPDGQNGSVGLVMQYYRFNGVDQTSSYEQKLRLFTHVEEGAGPVLVDDRLATIDFPDTAPSDNLVAITAVPVGPCEETDVPWAGDDAAPLAISLVSADSDWSQSRIFFADLEEIDRHSTAIHLYLSLGERQIDVAYVSGSYCVADELGGSHRLLALTLSEDLDGDDVPEWFDALIDLGDGIEVVDGENPDLGDLRVEIVWNVQSFGRARGDDGTPRLLATIHRGYWADTEVFSLHSSGPSLLRPERTLLAGLPAFSSFTDSADLTAPGSRDLVSVLAAGNGEGGLSGILVVASQTWQDAMDPVVGTSELAYPVPWNNRWARIGDADRDGRDELYMVFSEVIVENNQEVESWHLVVNRGGEW